MKLGNHLIRRKFEDIDGRIDFMIEFCQTLQLENKELLLKIKGLETEIKKQNKTDKNDSAHEALVQNKMDGLLKKLNYFSDDASGDSQSNG